MYAATRRILNRSEPRQRRRVRVFRFLRYLMFHSVVVNQARRVAGTNLARRRGGAKIGTSRSQQTMPACRARQLQPPRIRQSAADGSACAGSAWRAACSASCFFCFN
jgi:hypothetical protein